MEKRQMEFPPLDKKQNRTMQRSPFHFLDALWYFYRRKDKKIYNFSRSNYRKNFDMDSPIYLYFFLKTPSFSPFFSIFRWRGLFSRCGYIFFPNSFHIFFCLNPFLILYSQFNVELGTVPPSNCALITGFFLE